MNETGAKVLLLKRKQAPYVEWWSFPGGKTEPGEELQASVRREIYEETEAQINNAQLCILLNERLYRGSELQAHFFINYWKTQVEEKSVVERDTREGELRWFKIDALPKFIVPSDRQVLEFCMTRGKDPERSLLPVFIEGVLEEREDSSYPLQTRLDLIKWEQVTHVLTV